MGAHMEILEGDNNADTPEGSLKDETVDGRDENPFHEAGIANQVNRMPEEEYGSEFNNLSYRVGLNETSEQSTSHYLAGLNQSIKDEIGIVRLYNLEDAWQYALMAEKRVRQYGARKPIDDQIYDNSQGNNSAEGAAITNKTSRNIDKGKNVASSCDIQGNSKVHCFSCGGRGHYSYSCPRRQVNLAKFEEKLGEMSEPIYDDYWDEFEEVDVLPVKGESLMIQTVMTTTREEHEEDWQRHSIFRTSVLCGDKEDVEDTLGLKVVKPRKANSTKQFLVKWSDICICDSTWIAEEKFRKIGPDEHVEDDKSFNLNQAKFLTQGK
ncbi:hypothetical protein SLEP1_g26365 [Rubroshorea leprosula]|uniref:CCHC-type domain-containing protein n=1 Tax=Rubroshorea leprosula TaxID=152421 RepID=A0AAV5JY06_9ROSI|nr:hypothetical protein SLEP1_g26365 [Rubroshorea leprosula]